MAYFAYLLLCDDGSYYAGHTKDVALRLEQHKLGRGARYTRMHKPKRVVYTEKLKSRRAAMRRERWLKRLTHNEKLRLVARRGRHRLQQT